jgi:glycine/D-amino acid oxidase-like deaminating enzyme
MFDVYVYSFLFILSLSHHIATVEAWSYYVTSAAKLGRRSTTTSLSMSSPSSTPTATSSNSINAPNRVIIVGAGVVGTSTAYYLAERFGIASTLIDPSGTIAPAASGKAGGFLALDWNDGSPIGPLTRRSFALHQELADTLGADKLQYRRLTCASIAVDVASQGRRPRGKKLDFVEWAQDNDGGGSDTVVLAAQPMGDVRTIAQVHPKKLCDAFWEVASKSKNEGGVGSTLLKGKVVKVLTADDDDDDDDKVTGVQLDDGTVVEGDAVLLSCGPWTANLMRGVKYHAVLIPTERTLHQCVFFSGAGDPEVYVRPDQTAYCCGFPDEITKVTEEPGKEEVRPEAVKRIVDAVRLATSSTNAAVSGVLSAAPSVASACY